LRRASRAQLQEKLEAAEQQPVAATV